MKFLSTSQMLFSDTSSRRFSAGASLSAVPVFARWSGLPVMPISAPQSFPNILIGQISNERQELLLTQRTEVQPMIIHSLSSIGSLHTNEKTSYNKDDPNQVIKEQSHLRTNKAVDVHQ